jgi:hypothetical protein
VACPPGGTPTWPTTARATTNGGVGERLSGTTDDEDDDDDNDRKEEEDEVDKDEGRRARDRAQDTIATTTARTATAAGGRRRASATIIIEPFPTLYWLTSPALRSRVSAIKGSVSNSVSAVETRLRSSPINAIGMERAHSSYGAERWALLTDEDREEANRRGGGRRWTTRGGWWG